MRRIVIYSHDTFGLGNIRRMMEIARHLAAEDPDVSILMLTGSPMLHAFRIPPRIDYVKLPCLSRTRDGEYAVKFLSLHYQDTVRMRANLILSAVLDFQPDLILVDKKPLGVGNELAPVLEALERRAPRPKMVLLLRDILDAPAATTAIWRKNRYFEAIDAFYDQVLVVGSPEVFDVRKEYEFPERVAAKVQFCGFIGRGAGASSGQAIRSSFGDPDTPLVLASAGGGEDGFELLSTYIESLAYVPREQRFRSIVLSGPEMSPDLRARLRAAASRFGNVRVEEFTDNFMSYLDAADVSVSMGGYNTVCEILTLRKRAVIVPRVKPVEEQWIRAERLAALGLVAALHPAQLTPKLMATSVLRQLAPTNVIPHARSLIDMHGLERIATALRELTDVPAYGAAEFRAPLEMAL